VLMAHVTTTDSVKIDLCSLSPDGEAF
jgi:hypothetical protein